MSFLGAKKNIGSLWGGLNKICCSALPGTEKGGMLIPMMTPFTMDHGMLALPQCHKTGQQKKDQGDQQSDALHGRLTTQQKTNGLKILHESLGFFLIIITELMES